VDLASIVKILNLKVYSGMDKLNRSILGGYTGDLLSDVMANSQEGDIWVTRQVHQNIIAVASLKDHAGIILVHGAEPAKDTLDKAIKEMKTDDAYAACSALRHQYPDLVNDPRLIKTVLAVSLAQQGLVKMVSKATPPAAGEVETAAIRAVTLAQCTTKANVQDVEGQVMLAAGDGAGAGGCTSSAAGELTCAFLGLPAPCWSARRMPRVL